MSKKIMGKKMCFIHKIRQVGNLIGSIINHISLRICTDRHIKRHQITKTGEKLKRSLIDRLKEKLTNTKTYE